MTIISQHYCVDLDWTYFLTSKNTRILTGLSFYSLSPILYNLFLNIKRCYGTLGRIFSC